MTASEIERFYQARQETVRRILRESVRALDAVAADTAKFEGTMHDGRDKATAADAALRFDVLRPLHALAQMHLDAIRAFKIRDYRGKEQSIPTDIAKWVTAMGDCSRKVGEWFTAATAGCDEYMTRLFAEEMVGRKYSATKAVMVEARSKRYEADEDEADEDAPAGGLGQYE